MRTLHVIEVDIVDILNLIKKLSGIKVEILELPRAHVEYPPMHMGVLALSPRALHVVDLHDVDALLTHVELHEAVVALAEALYGIELGAVGVVDITNCLQPPIELPHIFGVHRRLDSSALVVSADDYVFDFEVLHGVLHHGIDVAIGVDHDIADVAMHEQFAGLDPH